METGSIAGRQTAVIVDIDGVLADNSHRIHHIKRTEPMTPKDWEKFYEQMLEDKPYNGFPELVRLLYRLDVVVVLLTGRPYIYKVQTEQWLRTHSIPYDELLMRTNWRNDSKREHLHNINKEYDIAFAIDDDPENISMFIEEGIPIIEVRSGYYDEGKAKEIFINKEQSDTFKLNQEQKFKEEQQRVIENIHLHEVSSIAGDGGYGIGFDTGKSNETAT